ncbi:MAG: ABC transporter substrate-binding protein [Treponema sp.]|nr:ABC transporter substrate-binding protein [Treponema sp.]
MGIRRMSIVLALAAAFTAAGAASAQGRQLIVALDPDYQTFDPALAYEAYSLMVLHPTYDTLMQFETNTEDIKYGAAESYAIAPDGLTYTFKLRKGIKFASGNPLTANDVKWSVERAINLKGNGAFLAEGVSSVSAPDDYTVVFRLSAKDSSFLTKVTSNVYAIIDSKTAMAHGATNAADAATSDKAKLWFDGHSAGSGPYILESYTPQVEVVLVRNKNYWGKAPYFDKVTLKSIKDPGTQLMMLQKKDIDVAFNLGPEQVKQVKGLKGIAVAKAQSMTLTFMLMNRDPAVGGPIANPDVQKAIRLALDYVGMQTIAGEGSITPVAPFQVGFFGTVPPRDPKTAQNLAKARELMKKAGYPNGFKTTFEVPTQTVEGMDLPTLAQKIQSDLKQINIDTDIKTSDIMVALDPYRKGKQALSLWYWGPDYPDPNNQLAFLPGNSVGLRANWTAAMDPKLAALGEKTAVETNPKARAADLKSIQEMMDADTAFAVLLQSARQYAYASDLEGAYYNDYYKLNLAAISR